MHFTNYSYIRYILFLTIIDLAYLGCGDEKDLSEQQRESSENVDHTSNLLPRYAPVDLKSIVIDPTTGQELVKNQLLLIFKEGVEFEKIEEVL